MNTITFSEFISLLFSNPSLFITVMFTLGVVLVNGWTDAPNAIATCVSTRSIRPKAAIIMAAIFNFLGVLIMSVFNSQVAQTIYNIADFAGNPRTALIALCAAMFAIVIWATVAWKFGIPTSESHALIAGVSGAAIALQNGFHGLNSGEWVKVLYGLLLSTGLGFFSGFLTVRFVETIFKNRDRTSTMGFFKNSQIFGGAAMAFMHGAQDGQKFIGVFLLGVSLSKGEANTDSFQIPLWLMILCSLVMAIGTSIGGYRIIKAVGMDMVKLEKYQGFSSDLASTGCLLLSSLTGLPVSTTHTKTTAMMGVAASRRLKAVNWGVVNDMVVTWIMTFPGCGFIGYLVAKLFIYIF